MCTPEFISLDLEDLPVSAQCTVPTQQNSTGEIFREFTKASRKGLLPGADLEFFSLILSIASRGWSIESMHEFFEIKFSEVLAEPSGSELDSIMKDESRDRQSRLIMVLSKAIMNCAPTADQATAKFVESLSEVESQKQVSIIILLIHHNESLLFQCTDEVGWRPRDDSNQRQYCLSSRLLHLLLDYLDEDGARRTIRSLIRAGANVVYPNNEGVTPLEAAAAKCDPETFQLFYDSAKEISARNDIFLQVLDEPTIFDLDTLFSIRPIYLKWHHIVEKIFYSTIKSLNIPAMDFLILQLSNSQITQSNFWSDFGARLIITIVMQLLVINKEYELD